MKQYKYLYQKMCSEEVVRKAYKNLRKGKTKRKEIQYIDSNLDEEVKSMQKMIINTKPEGIGVEFPELAFSPKKHEPKYIYEHGKRRKIYMPEIREQWLHHIIIIVLEPIIMSTAYRFSCGSLPKRGAHYGKRQIEKWIREKRNIRNYVKMDICHFYDSIRLDILMRELRVQIKDEWFLHFIEICLKEFKRGIPIGFYISQWLANYLLEPLDRFITESLGLKLDMRYMDDISIFENSKKKLHTALIEIQKFIGRRFRLKLKRNYQVCKFHFEKKDGSIAGRPLDFMGFVFYRDRTIMRKGIMISATRLARKMMISRDSGRGYFAKRIKAMLSYIGWFDCTDTYRCYLERIKPFIVRIGALKKIVSKMDRRMNEYDTMERRANRTMSCGITTCSA